MPQNRIVSPFAIAVAIATTFACLGAIPAGAAERPAAVNSPSPAPTPGATTPVADPASPSPTASPKPSPSPTGTPAITGDDPDLATQTRAGNHSMGSTIEAYDQASRTVAPRSLVATPSVSPPGVPGLDVSGWQTNVDWAQVAANGAKFAYVKATESIDYTSSRFPSQYNGAYNAGLIRGAYHFAVPNKSSGAVQANFFMNNGGGWTQDGRTLPPLLDIEYNPYTATDDTDTCYGLDPGQMVSWIADFSNTIYQRTGRLPAIYSTTGWWTQCTGNSAAFGTNPLFIARYPSNIANGPGTLPAGWNSYTMWQYASSGIFPGDQDVFNGSLATLQQFAFTGRALAQPVIGTGDLNGDGKPDLLARRPDGTLWFYAGQGAAGGSVGYAAGVQVGTQWGVFDDLLMPGDITGDGVPDLLARKTNGTILVYPISPTGDGGISIGSSLVLSSGWDAFTDVIAAGDVNGDRLPDVLGRRPDGTLWLYAGTGKVDGSSTGFQAGRQIGTSWNIFTQVIGIGDLDKDGWDDLLGIRLDGSVWYYRGSASGYQPGARASANGVVAGDLLIAAGDANGDGRPDLLTRSSSGALKFSAGAMLTQPAFGSAQTVGSGWGVFNRVIGAGDVTGDGAPDIVATTTDGNLYLYSGNGSTGGVNKSYRAGIRIGWGWTGFTRVLNAGDFTGDGRPDLLAVRTDGSLWLYPSTGVVNPTTPSTYSSGIRIGTTGWTDFTMLAAADFNGDGMPDVLATRADGTAVLYPGVRQTPSSTSWLGAPVSVGPGWNVYSAIVSTGDSNGDGRPDVIATRPDGTLWILAGTGASSGPLFSAGAVIGSGWNIFSSVTGTGDRSTGRTGDLLGVRTDGALLYYPSTNVAAVANVPGYATTVVAGSGWNIFG